MTPKDMQEIKNDSHILELLPNLLYPYRAEWWRDFLPRLDRVGAKREKDIIINLSSNPRARAFDHECMSPTYQRNS